MDDTRDQSGGGDQRWLTVKEAVIATKASRSGIMRRLGKKDFPNARQTQGEGPHPPRTWLIPVSDLLAAGLSVDYPAGEEGPPGGTAGEQSIACDREAARGHLLADNAPDHLLDEQEGTPEGVLPAESPPPAARGTVVFPPDGLLGEGGLPDTEEAGESPGALPLDLTQWRERKLMQRRDQELWPGQEAGGSGGDDLRDALGDEAPGTVPGLPPAPEGSSNFWDPKPLCPGQEAGGSGGDDLRDALGDEAPETVPGLPPAPEGSSNFWDPKPAWDGAIVDSRMKEPTLEDFACLQSWNPPSYGVCDGPAFTVGARERARRALSRAFPLAQSASMVALHYGRYVVACCEEAQGTVYRLYDAVERRPVGPAHYWTEGGAAYALAQWVGDWAASRRLWLAQLKERFMAGRSQLRRRP